jgi:hypothetical protein
MLLVTSALEYKPLSEEILHALGKDVENLKWLDLEIEHNSA